MVKEITTLHNLRTNQYLNPKTPPCENKNYMLGGEDTWLGLITMA